MNTTTESYAGILKLLVAYELQHTLSPDEFARKRLYML